MKKTYVKPTFASRGSIVVITAAPTNGVGPFSAGTNPP